MTQKKSKKDRSIPTDKILEYNEKELRSIANRQIKSLIDRWNLTGNNVVYIHEINKVILHEKGVI